MQYTEFVKDVDNMLIRFKQVPLGTRDDCTMVHSFGYGHSVQLTFENVVYNRRMNKIAHKRNNSCIVVCSV